VAGGGRRVPWRFFTAPRGTELLRRRCAAAPRPHPRRLGPRAHRPRPAEDLDRAPDMLEQAEETAERLGGGLITREVAECHAALAATNA
jgi:hypothetical protein